ncbi:MAG: hypothetical protein KAT04_00410, partial [Methylococcales bacterium]|nr:hypothetical protein [Methylococcales bacterium]
DVFFTDDDCLICLEWLKLYCEKYNISVLAYCLMTNQYPPCFNAGFCRGVATGIKTATYAVFSVY